MAVVGLFRAAIQMPQIAQELNAGGIKHTRAFLGRIRRPAQQLAAERAYRGIARSLGHQRGNEIAAEQDVGIQAEQPLAARCLYGLVLRRCKTAILRIQNQLA